MLPMFLEAHYVFIKFLKSWFNLDDLTCLDTALCNKTLREQFLNIMSLELCCFNRTFDLNKVPNKQAMYLDERPNRRLIYLCDLQKQSLLNWMKIRFVSFKSVVIDGMSNFRDVFEISKSHCVSLKIQSFCSKYTHVNLEFAKFLNHFKVLTSLQFESCAFLYDTDFMDIDSTVLERLKTISVVNCLLKDHACLYLARCCPGLQEFYFKPNHNIASFVALKESTLLKVLQSCIFLTSLDVDMISVSDLCLNQIGCRMVVMQINIIMGSHHHCNVGIKSFSSLIKRCDNLKLFRIRNIRPDENIVKQKCLFLLQRQDCKTILRLIVSENNMNREEYLLQCGEINLNEEQDLFELAEVSANIVTSLTLKCIRFFTVQNLHKFAKQSPSLKQLWLIRCGHNCTVPSLMEFVDYCPRLEKINLFDCGQQVFTDNCFTQITKIVLKLTLLDEFNTMSEQWTNEYGVPLAPRHISKVKVGYFDEDNYFD